MEPPSPDLAMSLKGEFFKHSYKLSSAVEDAAISNIQAISESDISNSARSTFGPHYRNTFLINNMGFLPLTRTLDVVTVNREKERSHSANKRLVNSSQLQQAEVCDGTKTVIILAGELLKQAEHLLIMGVHPSEIRKGYEVTCRKALGELQTLSTMTLPTPLTLPSLTHALKPVLATKFGSEDILAALVAEAALAVMPTREKGFRADNVRVVKIVGGNLSASKVVIGMAFGRESESTIKHATAAKVAVFTCALDIAQTETEGTALIKNADKTKEEHLAKIIEEIAASGITVIIAGSSVSDLALQCFNRHAIAVLKVLSKFELRRICRVVNATPLERMRTPTPEEVGWIDVYETVEFDGDRMTVLRQLVAGDPGFEKSGKRGDGKGDKTPTATIVLRGPNAIDLDDLESAIDDGMSLIRSLLRDRRLVPGAGAAELALAKLVDAYGGKMKGPQRHVAKRFAMALEVIPRTLAENAAVGEGEGIEGVNGENEATEPSDSDMAAKPPSDSTTLADSNSLPYPILDSLEVKRCAIKNTVEAAASVLNIDSVMSVQGMPRQLTTIFEIAPLSTHDIIVSTILIMFASTFLRVAYRLML